MSNVPPAAFMNPATLFTSGHTRWTVTEEWNRWVRVEQLAADDHLFRTLANEYLGLLEGVLGALGAGTKRWIDRCDEVISDRKS